MVRSALAPDTWLISQNLVLSQQGKCQGQSQTLECCTCLLRIALWMIAVCGRFQLFGQCQPRVGSVIVNCHRDVKIGQELKK